MRAAGKGVSTTTASLVFQAGGGANPVPGPSGAILGLERPWPTHHDSPPPHPLLGPAGLILEPCQKPPLPAS